MLLKIFDAHEAPRISKAGRSTICLSHGRSQHYVPQLTGVSYVTVNHTFSGISFSISLNTEMSVFRSVNGRKCDGKNDGSNVPSKYGHGGLLISSSNIPGRP